MNVLQVLIAVKTQGESAVARVNNAISAFTGGIQNRIAAVKAFNSQISNGEAALQRWGSIAAAAFSTAALRNYMQEAAEADRVQRKLLQSLQRLGELRSQKVLEDQQAALQRVTRAKDDEIATIQRLLLTNGLSVQQTIQLTEATLDFAEATGQSFESAGALVSRTLRDNGEEIGRYNIRLDQSKSRYEALRGALTNYAAGQARAAVVDKQAHAASVDLGEAGERIGRALNKLAGPVLSAFVPVLEKTADVIASVGAALQPIASPLATLFAKFAGFAGLLLGLKTAFNGVLAVVNPLRAGFVAIAGVNFGTINQFTKELGFMQTMQLATWGQRAAAGLSLVGAAIAGWQIGTFLKEIEVGGFKIEDWIAQMINVWFGWADELGAAARTAWVFFKYNFLGKLKEGEVAILEFAKFSAETLNKIFPKKWQLPIDPLKDAIAEARKELNGLITEEGNAMSEIERDLARKREINAAVADDLHDQGRAAVAAGNAPSDPLPAAPPLLAGEAGPDKSEIEKQQRREIFELETKILQARAEGRQKDAEDLQAIVDSINMLRDLGREHGEMVSNRINASNALRDQERKRTEEERVLGEKLGAIARERALVEGNRYLTEEQKQKAILPLLQEENRLISERIKLLEAELLLGATDERRGQIQQQLEQLRGQQATNAADQAGAQPQSMFGGMLEGVVNWLKEIGSVSQQIASTMKTTIGTAVDSISRGIYGLITRTMTWKEALLSVGQSILGTLLQAIIQLGVRTIATMLLNAVAGKAILAASTAAMLPLAAAQSAIWATPATLATIASFGGAAAQAPIAVLGALGVTKGAVAGMAATGFSDGGMTAKGPKNKPAGIVHAGEWVAPAWMLESPIFGPMIGMLEAARTGVKGFMVGGLVGASALAAMPAQIDAGMSRPYVAGEDPDLIGTEENTAPRITVINVPDDREATRIARKSAAAGDVVYIVKNNLPQIFGSGYSRRG